MKNLRKKLTKRSTKPKRTVVIKLDADLFDQVKARLDQDGVSWHSLFRAAVSEYLS